MKSYWILFIGVSILCSLTFPNNRRILSSKKGVCSVIKQRFSTAAKKSILSGVLIDCELQKPLKIGVVNINGRIFNTDSLGRFHQEVEPGKYVIRAGWPSYKFETIKTKIRVSDSLHIVFYLSSDKQPLVD